MEPSDFLRSAGAILAAMAALSLLETLLPLMRRPDRRRLHRAPNLALVVLTLALNLAFNAGAVLLAGWLGAQGFELLAGAALPPLAVWLIALVALDGSTWVCHRLLHAIPWLWRVHRVHHSDPLVDVTTTLRQHPFEGFVRFLFILAPAWALGLPAEAVAGYRALSALVGLAEHINVRLWHPLDRALSWLACTPNMHKLHHSRLPQETDSNFGNLFSLYDRVFRTFRPASPARAVDYGLAGLDDPGSQTLGALLRLPLRP
jgi:sterol desaturase/sphingolipid hydroxylase (fatty acid hydroxylase superfamily)